MWGNSMGIGYRGAEARLRRASAEAPISGHGVSTGAIDEQHLRQALPQRRRRDGERDGGPRDSRWIPHRSDKDRVSTYRTLQGKTKLIKQFFRTSQPLGGSDKNPDTETGRNRGKQRPASLRRRRAAEPLPVQWTFGFRDRSPLIL